MAEPPVAPAPKDHEGELAARWRAGDREAGRRLVELCRPLVVALARRYRRWGRPLEDLVQEGNVGLLKAAWRHDGARGASLRTYASFWIRAHIREYLFQGYRIVRLGSSKSERRALLIYQRTREQDPERLAAASGLSLEKATALLQVLMGRDLSLDLVPDDGVPIVERLAADLPSPEESASGTAERDTTAVRLRSAVDELPAREQLIMRSRWLTETPRTLAELGTELGVSTERVRQLEASAKQRIRAKLASDELAPPASRW